MKSSIKEKDNNGAIDAGIFANSAIKGLPFICCRLMEMKTTKEHKTILHVLIIHGMNQKFNHLSNIKSTDVWSNMKKIATKIHKETQRKKEVFFNILFCVNSCKFVAKKIGGTMVKNYRLAIDFTINIDEEIKAQGKFNVRKQFIDNYPLIINYFKSNPDVLREFLKTRFCEFYLDSYKAIEFVKLLEVKDFQEVFLPMLSNLSFDASLCLLRIFYNDKMDIHEGDIKKTEDELALFLEQFYQIHFTQTSFEEIGESLEQGQDLIKEMAGVNQAPHELNNNEINLSGKE